MQADAYAGFNRLYAPHRGPGPIVEAACWAHGRRNLELAQVSKAPIAAEAVTRWTGCSPSDARSMATAPSARLEVRPGTMARVVGEFEAWLRTQRNSTSRRSEIGKAIDYALSA